MSRRHRKTRRDDEDQMVEYGYGEILNYNDVEPTHERELWAAVIYQAVIDVACKVKYWEHDLMFLKGCRNFNWICEQLGLDPLATSRAAVATANSKSFRFVKRT